jgi:L-amino acid N-acyltransferase YncA
MSEVLNYQRQDVNVRKWQYTLSNKIADTNHLVQTQLKYRKVIGTASSYKTENIVAYPFTANVSEKSLNTSL